MNPTPLVKVDFVLAQYENSMVLQYANVKYEL